MKFEDRWYQIECEDALVKCILETPQLNPVAAIPTGGGKTKIIGSTISKILECLPHYRILVVSHTEDIVKQDYDAIQEFFPGIEIGLYSSGLNSKTIRKITVGGIQSLYRVANRLTNFDIVIVDEAHTVPVKGAGMYRSLFSKIKCIRVGVSATIFRSNHGYIHEGEGAMFDTLVYDLTSVDNFNRLVDEGYLTKLYALPTLVEMNSEGIKETGGDFNSKALSEKFDREELTNAAIDETIKYGKKYKKWLLFAIDTKHADGILSSLQVRGIKASVLHSNMDEKREDVVTNFKYGDTQALVSVGMVTTGFDSPNINLIVLLRPTKSIVLHVQMVGRGLRVFEGKDHCLVLDFAGNTLRLGPINDVVIPKKKQKGKKLILPPPAKSCPNCHLIVATSTRVCPVCSHIFEFECKITTKASSEEIVRKVKKKDREPEWQTVTQIFYHIHKSSGKPDSMRVTYQLGLAGSVTEFVCYNHSGFAKQKALQWVASRLLLPRMPPDVDALIKCTEYLKAPKAIFIDRSAKWPIIKNYAF